MTRKTIFDAIKAARGGKDWTPAEVATVDNMLDGLGIARDDAGSTGLKPSKAATQLIMRFEGCKLTAYPDPGSGGDPWTIGFGSTGPGIKRGVTWTQEMANARLASDVAKFGERVAAVIGKAPTTQNQFDALTSFAYNVGVQALKESTLMRLHKEGDYDGAADQFARWNKAGGRVLNGLTARRAAEAAMYRGEA